MNGLGAGLLNDQVVGGVFGRQSWHVDGHIGIARAAPVPVILLSKSWMGQAITLFGIPDNPHRLHRQFVIAHYLV